MGTGFLSRQSTQSVREVDHPHHLTSRLGMYGAINQHPAYAFKASTGYRRHYQFLRIYNVGRVAQSV
jgi:hypothetical protein